MRIGLGALLVTLTLALSACGSGSGNSAGTTSAPAAEGTMEDRQAIEATITRLSTKADPESCTEAATANWVEDNYPPATGSLEACRRQQQPGEKILARDVRFGAIEIDGNEAVASVEQRGPDVGGARLKVKLLQDGAGVWRVDDLLGFNIVDRDRYFDSFRAEITHGTGAFSGPQADCVVGRISSVPEAKLELWAVSGDHSATVPILADCIGGGSVTAAAVEIARRSLSERPRYADHADCVADGLGKVLNEAQARDFLAFEDRTTIQLLVGRMLSACGAAPPLPPGDSALS